MTVWRSLMAGLKAVFGPTAEEQEAQALLSAIWRERAQQDQRRALDLIARGRPR